MSGNISCSHCGNQLSEQDMFCGQCGTPRSLATEHSTTICVHCGYPRDPSQPFCAHCNSQAPTEPGTTPHQQSQAPKLDAFSQSKGSLSNLKRVAAKPVPDYSKTKERVPIAQGKELPRYFWNADKALPADEKIPSYILWYKLLQAFGPPLIIVFVVLPVYLANETTATTNSSAALNLSLPAMLIGYA